MSSNIKASGLFLNPTQANCSIHESGRMVYECLKISEKYDLDYLEVNENQRQISAGYDFYAFNYHHMTMGWLDTKSVRRLPGLKLTFVLETLRNNPFVLCPSDAFDVYCALDPTMNVADKRVYGFPRPLEPAPILQPYQEQDIPVIGSFGFATQGKGFELVVEAVNKEFDRAKIRINIPFGTYANSQYAEHLSELCRKTAKEGVELSITHEYMDKNELIQWCSQNTLNCFLYNRNMPGLSATTDQAISSGRPLSISTNETFRHIHPYIKPYPLRSLRESITQSQSEVLRLQEDWHPRNFMLRFEQVLEEFSVFEQQKRSSLPELVALQKIKDGNRLTRIIVPVVKKVVVNIAPPLVMKSVQRFRKRNSNEARLPPRMQPLFHRLLQSHSQFQEDLLIDVLLRSKDKGFYVDVGANDPTFNSNTKRFYDRGWSGINIEPGAGPYKELCKARARDINLNLGVGSTVGTLTFYDIANDSTISSFDFDAAQRMSTFFGFPITPTPVSVKPLRDILAEHASGRAIDFLSVDAEGVDLDVLQSNDWKTYRPSLVLVEMNNQTKEIVSYLTDCDYFLIFNNEYNGLFVDLRTSDPHLRNLLDKNYN